ncbi:Cytochrome c oxidase subunit 3, partial [Cucurbita argyrosperma subsp. sororia]
MCLVKPQSRTLFLIICGIRQYLGHLTKEHHVGFEATAFIPSAQRNLMNLARNTQQYPRDFGFDSSLTNS